MAMKENLFPVEDILQTGEWSNVKTFAKFYDKPIDSACTTSNVLFNMTPMNVGPTGFEISSAPLCSCPAVEYIYIGRDLPKSKSDVLFC